jgi:hypothetical protein
MQSDELSDNELEREVAIRGGRITVRELRARVTSIEPGVVQLRELDGATVETLTIMGKRIAELTRDLDRYSILVDLSDASGATTAEYRRFIPQFFTNMHERGALKHVAVTFYGNAAVRIASKFLIARMMSVPFSIHGNRAQALQAARDALR